MRIPVVTVKLDGKRLSARVLSLRVTGRISAPAQAEVQLEGAAVGWPTGDRLEIEISDEPLFDGEVTAVESVRGPGSEAAWILRGYDLLHRLRKRQEPRVFENLTIADLAQELTGLEIACDNPGPRIDRLVQHRQSDWDLLQQTAARAGRYLYLAGETLHIGPLRSSEPPIKLEPWTVRAESNLDCQVSGVTAIGWHPQRGEVVTAKATGDQPGDGRTLLDQPPTHLEEAAQAALDLSTARGFYVEGVARGDVALRPGRGVTIEGFDGVFPICTAVHTVTAEGYQVRFSTEPPAAIVTPTSTSVTLGRVESVSDPDGAGRVRVSLPAYGDVDIGWLAVLCPGAGPGKGIVALPDPGDVVVIALPHENPAEGIVLGSIFGPAAPPDAGVSGDRVQRWTLHSGAGQSIVIDDAARSLKLSNADGSVLELSPDQVILRARTDMVIEAPGHHLNFRAASIDFDHAVLP